MPGRHTSGVMDMSRRDCWELLTNLYNITMESEMMPEEWRDNVMRPFFNNKGDVVTTYA